MYHPAAPGASHPGGSRDAAPVHGVVPRRYGLVAGPRLDAEDVAHDAGAQPPGARRLRPVADERAVHDELGDQDVGPLGVAAVHEVDVEDPVEAEPHVLRHGDRRRASDDAPGPQGDALLGRVGALEPRHARLLVADLRGVRGPEGDAGVAAGRVGGPGRDRRGVVVDGDAVVVVGVRGEEGRLERRVEGLDQVARPQRHRQGRRPGARRARARPLPCITRPPFRTGNRRCLSWRLSLARDRPATSRWGTGPSAFTKR